MFPHILSTGEEFRAYIESLGTDIIHVAGIRENSLYKLSVIDKRLHRCTEYKLGHLHIVFGLTHIQVLIVEARADMKCGSTVVNRAVKPASAYSHALISRRLVVVKIFGKYTDIGIERSIVIFVSDTKLTTRTQSHGRSGTVDEVQAAERGVARMPAGSLK